MTPWYADRRRVPAAAPALMTPQWSVCRSGRCLRPRLRRRRRGSSTRGWRRPAPAAGRRPRAGRPRARPAAAATGRGAAEDVDAGGVLPDYAGTIVRDGYAGYKHLTDALHAWCGAHGLRDLRAVYELDPDGQLWARSMADLLISANTQATAARAAGQARLSDAQLAEVIAWYRAAVAKGIADNQCRRSPSGKDGLRLARRFRD